MAVFAPIPSASVRTAMRVKPGDLRSWRRAKRRSFIFVFPGWLSRRYFRSGWFDRDTAGAGPKNERLAAAVDLSLHLLAIGSNAHKRQIARHSSGTRFRFDIQPGIRRNGHFDTAGGRFQI